ncbi:exosortase N [Pedobacter psychrodurus]|uniref:Exosortase N n=1 Tax=Pedobacter psychrodurus TaxID=2530456 RepID=A0A4R0PIL6_9SPHI|nr:exosortase N [Pedobacter psychrodurus]TCD16874.1 exosortase N [Pedobacter psychrodurus]
MLAINLKKPAFPFKFAGISFVYLIILLWFLPGFLNWGVNLYAGLLLAPFICNLKPGQFSLRYLIPTVTAIVLAIFIPVKTLFFIALLFAALLFIENSLGKLSEAFLFLLFLLSPVFKYLIATIDFPIRLWLTAKVTELLNSMGTHAVAFGNIIELEKHSFAVDPACAGLNMLVISLIISLFLLVYNQKRINKQPPFILVGGLFLLTIGLNICSNFFRILLLVLFKIMPDTVFHDAIGLICLSIYVIVPLIFVSKVLIIHFSTFKKQNPNQNRPANYNVRLPLLHITILALLIFIALNMVKADHLTPINNQIQLSGFKKKLLETGISKFENNEALIYIKPAPFYVPGHDPKLCWTGSGYDFNNIKKEKIANTEIYTAILSKGADRIYAAWWFDNGTIKSINQLSWRWSGAMGSQLFYLVNVNANNRKNLHHQVAQLLANHHYLTDHE